MGINMPVDYTKKVTPGEYRCCECGAGSSKLWRDMRAVATQVSLYCVWCAADKAKRPSVLEHIGGDGFHVDLSLHIRTDQIGALLPAVPTAEGDTFWGYTSVPEDGVAWWRALPTFPRN